MMIGGMAAVGTHHSPPVGGCSQLLLDKPFSIFTMIGQREHTVERRAQTLVLVTTSIDARLLIETTNEKMCHQRIFLQWEVQLVQPKT
jgi:hypothetical protein